MHVKLYADMQFLWASLSHGDSFKTITLRILLRTTPKKVECLSRKIISIIIAFIIIIIISRSSSSSSSSVNNSY